MSSEDMMSLVETFEYLLFVGHDLIPDLLVTNIRTAAGSISHLDINASSVCRDFELFYFPRAVVSKSIDCLVWACHQATVRKSVGVVVIFAN